MFTFLKKKIKSKSVTIIERSNIVQLDDMGYPLLLCIMSDGTQQWIDVNSEWVKKNLKSGNLNLLEWTKTTKGSE